jgi:hypothetical protein
MAQKVKRVRSKEVGFVGANLAKGGDMTLYDRLMQEVKSDPELDQSKVIRLALKEYFDKRDNKK